MKVIPFPPDNSAAVFFECIRCGDQYVAPGSCPNCLLPLYVLDHDGYADYRMSGTLPRNAQLRKPVKDEPLWRAFAVAMVFAILMGSIAGYYFFQLAELYRP